MNEYTRQTFFVVDDDEDVSFFISRALEHAIPSAHIVCFAQALQCQQHLETEEQPAMLITDLDMPEIDGLQLIGWVRAHSAMKFPLIVFSGSGSSSMREKCYKLGANAFVTKDTELSGLTECVRGFLQAGLVPAR